MLVGVLLYVVAMFLPSFAKRWKIRFYWYVVQFIVLFFNFFHNFLHKYFFNRKNNIYLHRKSISWQETEKFGSLFFYYKPLKL